MCLGKNRKIPFQKQVLAQSFVSTPQRNDSGFTLIELLISLAIVAVLSGAVILVLNPAETLREARDAARLVDLRSIDKALGIFRITVPAGFFGNNNVVYVSLPDSSPTCGSYSLPALPMGWSYGCSTSANYRNVNGTGWVPVDFSQISYGSPLNVIPIDQVNDASQGLYYTYVVGSWELTALMESGSYRTLGAKDVVSRDGGDSEVRFEVGENLTITPDIGEGFVPQDPPDPPPPDTNPPTTPTNLNATAISISQIDLSWTSSTDAGGSGIAGYQIFRCLGAGCTPTTQFATTTGIGTTYQNFGLAASTTYVYRVAARDIAGNQSGQSGDASATTQENSLTTLRNGTNPPNTSLAPDGTATMLDAFSFETNTGTDLITTVTVSFAMGTNVGISLLEITNAIGTIVYGSASNPATDNFSLILGTPISASTALTEYQIRITPKTHPTMPGSPGGSYMVTGIITDWTGTNAKTGTDTDSATITIDNLSPGNVTSAGGVAGDTQITLNWTNPGDIDFSNLLVLRNTIAVTDVPIEGSSPAVGNIIGASVVRYISNGTSFIDTGLTNNTAYHYRIFSKDTNSNYSTGLAPTGSPFTPQTATTSLNTVPISGGSLAGSGWLNLGSAQCLANGTNCYGEVDDTPGSNDGDASYIQKGSQNPLDISFNTDISSIPDNSVINQINITFLCKRTGGTNTTSMRGFYVLNGSTSLFATNAACPGTSAYGTFTQNFTGLNITKFSSTDLEIGVRSAQSRSARVTSIYANIIYTR